MPELRWAVPQLLHALRVGHPSTRGRVIRLLEQLDDATLSRDPVAGALRELLAGDDGDLLRRAGGLIARRRLGAFRLDLLELLRVDAHRERAAGWLRHAGYPRPLEALVDVVVDAEAPLPTRRAAVRLLRGQPLEASQRERLLAGLDEPALQAGIVRSLGQADDALVARAVEANRAFGLRLRRERRERRTGSPDASWWERLWSPRATALGVFPDTAPAQAGFVAGIARLALAARSPRWVGALLPYLNLPGLTRDLVEAVVELRPPGAATQLRVLERLAGRQAPPLPVTIELLGRLSHEASAAWIAKQLPAHGRQASPAAQEALLALARLGRRETVGPYLVGALAGLRRELRQDPGGTPGHRSLWAAAFRAGAALQDPRFGELGLQLLAADVDVPEVDPVLGECLAALDPLELAPAVERALRSASARLNAKRAALTVVGRQRRHDLLPHVATLAGRELALVEEATRVVTELLEPGDSELVLGLLRDAEVGGATLSALLDRALELFSPPAAAAFARTMLDQGAGSARAQARALRHLRAGQDDLAQLQTCVSLLGSAHDSVRTAALREAVELGLLTREEPERAALREQAVGPLLQLAHEALRDAHESPQAERQLRVLFERALPRAGVEGQLDPDQAEDLRGRLRQAGLWHETATFHHAHRELLTLAGVDPALGLVHGALLLRLAGLTVRHPTTGARGRYPGPLPRFEQAFSLASPFVQEALFELVRGPAYLRTTGLTARFCASLRPRVRQEALSLFDRDACLAHVDDVLARLGDDAPDVRAAAVELLRRHELARFASELRPLLEDPVERVRLLAARTLADWGDQSCLGQLVGFLASDDARARREAVGYLRRFEPSQLIGLLAAHVSLDTPRAAAAVLVALRPERLPADEALLDAIFQVAARGRGPLRARALSFLPALVGARRLGDCVPLLADADARVRQAAAHVLRRRDGRRHAPAVAALAVETDVTRVRLEALALLGDLGVAEAARGLVPLLLDDDARVRGATRAALSTVRGFSLQPEVEATLARGLEGAAAPTALAELVAFLDRIGDEGAFVALQRALACEERRVWEAVLAAAKARGREDHVPRLVELLAASPGLPAPLATLALAEAARCGHGDAREVAARLAREAERDTVRRRALATARVLEGESGEGAASLGQGVGRGAVRRMAALEQAAKRGEDRRHALWQARGTATAAAAGVLSTGRRGGDLAALAKSLPSEVWRGQAPWRLREGIADRVAADSGYDPHAPLGVLPKDAREAARVGLVRGLRDRCSAPTFLRLLVSHVPAAQQDPRTLTVLELEADRPVNLRDQRARLDRFDDRRPRQRYEDLLLAIAAHWKPELGELLGDMVVAARDHARALPDDRWGGKQRRVTALALRYARWMQRLERVEQVEALTELAAGEPTLALRLAAALGDVETLVKTLDGLHGESLAEAREEGALLLGELGGARAVEVLGRLAHGDALRLRVSATAALGLTGDEAARMPVLPLLTDSEPGVRQAALVAVGRLGRVADTQVVAALGDADPVVAQRAVAVARALGLEQAAEALVRLTRPDPSEGAALDLARAAAEALTELAGEAQTDGVLRALRAVTDDALAQSLARVLVRVLPAARLDDAGALLGQEAPAAIQAGLRVLGERQHVAALEGVRSLLTHDAREVRVAACEAAGALGSAQLLPDLEARLDPEAEGQGRVRGAALRAWARLAGEGEATRARLHAALAGDQPFEVRLAAVETLRELPSAPSSNHALVQLVAGELWPELTLPDPGEPLSVLQERLAQQPNRWLRLRGSLLELLEATLATLATLGDPEACPRAITLVWFGLAGQRHPDEQWWPLFEAYGRARPAQEILPLLPDLARRANATAPRIMVFWSQLDPTGPMLDVLGEQLDPTAARPRRGTEGLEPALVAAAEAGLEAQPLACRALLRECLLSPRSQVRRRARAALEPGRRQALLEGGSL